MMRSFKTLAVLRAGASLAATRAFRSHGSYTAPSRVPCLAVVRLVHGEAAPQVSEDDRHDKSAASAKHVLYRGRWMVPFRVLVRLKIFQLVGIGALAVPINTFLVQVSLHTVRIAQCVRADTYACNLLYWHERALYLCLLLAALWPRPGPYDLSEGQCK